MQKTSGCGDSGKGITCISAMGTLSPGCSGRTEMGIGPPTFTNAYSPSTGSTRARKNG